jgi:hypothetical protein
LKHDRMFLSWGRATPDGQGFIALQNGMILENRTESNLRLREAGYQKQQQAS